MTSRTPNQALHSVPGNGGASPANSHVAEPFRGYLNRAAAIAILNAAQPEVMGDMEPLLKCPGYGCTETLGPDSGIIDGTRYCAGCVEDEKRESGREERRECAELFARGIL